MIKDPKQPTPAEVHPRRKYLSEDDLLLYTQLRRDDTEASTEKLQPDHKTERNNTHLQLEPLRGSQIFQATNDFESIISALHIQYVQQLQVKDSQYEELRSKYRMLERDNKQIR